MTQSGSMKYLGLEVIVPDRSMKEFKIAILGTCQVSYRQAGGMSP